MNLLKEDRLLQKECNTSRLYARTICSFNKPIDIADAWSHVVFKIVAEYRLACLPSRVPYSIEQPFSTATLPAL
uniref:Uncharacterized protein n=1 Tax=Parascaris equorum TaxID=6256 RepID=A0A914S0H4_PAREQ